MSVAGALESCDEARDSARVAATTCKLIRGTKIGEGCYAAVHATNDIAIKRYRARARPCPDFVIEVAIMQRIRHPNVVGLSRVIFNVKNGEFAIGMQAMDTDLCKLLNSGDVTLSLRTEIAYQLACGVGELHAHNIVHGDIKPSNVLVSVDGSDVRVKVCDFGFSVTNATDAAAYLPELYAIRYRSVGATFRSADLAALQMCDVYAYGVVVCDLIASTTVSSVSDNTLDQVRRRAMPPSHAISTLEDLAASCIAQRLSFRDIVGLDSMWSSVTRVPVSPSVTIRHATTPDVESDAYRVLLELESRIDDAGIVAGALARATRYAGRRRPVPDLPIETLCKHLYYFASNIVGPIEWYPPPCWAIDYTNPTTSREAYDVLTALNYDLL